MIELSKGQEVAVATADGTPVRRLRVGVGWDQAPGAGALSAGGSRNIDLDATAFQFSGGRLFDVAFYNNLATRDGSVVHRGDNLTGSGSGDDEQIDVDLGRVHPPVDTIVFLVSSYQGHSLEWIANAYCRLVDDSGEGEGTEIARFTLTLGVPQTGLVMAKLVRDPDDAGAWRVFAIGEGVDATKPTDSVAVLERFL
ncbi:TerD family protein [Nocardioides mangrovi]|uniref:TerD family protein n=1 Tax=Nocardioides mangrovi TaxID=2874580 RepID=A0ABS7UIR4_9ACTN|nr:TerD family protein [Nocardioides mangrovi]MBZ5740487.1 TerD family protein [Nocardioides mangrovi]